MHDSTLVALLIAFSLTLMGGGMGLSVICGALLGVWFR